MSKFKHFILSPLEMNEAAYKGNIGFEEMVRFYQTANPTDVKEMEGIIQSGNWDKFTKIIKRVTGTQLK
jgi:hypothetical protein